ncbi:hypothetical protein AB205_0221460 [Aquarana catesbeiana]|uniref:Uncharacterized protein n=1 Tax=Aquarana catesbeiana TaxID=8400 RepID=A0A2G9RZA6_AQUCT|nr:hypothetical protein AB205_0221460 [Aquarana catesbeiana]
MAVKNYTKGLTPQAESYQQPFCSVTLRLIYAAHSIFSKSYWLERWAVCVDMKYSSFFHKKTEVYFVLNTTVLVLHHLYTCGDINAEL